jgi:hypothetical protein
MGQFSPIYQAAGLFNSFQVKSWVLVSWLKKFARKPSKRGFTLQRRFIQFAIERFNPLKLHR